MRSESVSIPTSNLLGIATRPMLVTLGGIGPTTVKHVVAILVLSAQLQVLPLHTIPVGDQCPSRFFHMEVVALVTDESSLRSLAIVQGVGNDVGTEVLPIPTKYPIPTDRG